jgi:hypothetical protein
VRASSFKRSSCASSEASARGTSFRTDLPRKFLVVSQVHDTHPANAEHGIDSVLAYVLPDECIGIVGQ